MSSTPTTKQTAIEIITGLPETCTFDEIHYHLYVREKVEHGIEEYRRGNFSTQEVAEREAYEWLKSCGPARPNPT